MEIGKNTRISKTAKLDRTNPRGLRIGQSTSISFYASILTHDFVNNRHVDTEIGDFCFIGAHSIIMPGVRVGNHCIVGAGSVVMHDVPDNCIVSGNPARIVMSGINTGEYGIIKKISSNNNEGVHDIEEVKSESNFLYKSSAIYQYIKNELALSDEEMALPVADTAVDSFALIMLRSSIESTFRVEIPDEEWVSAHTLMDISAIRTFRALAASNVPGMSELVADEACGQSLAYSNELKASTSALQFTNEGRASAAFSIDMPQMAMSGLSESWFLKEVGNSHWKMISNFLQRPSSQIVDGRGERLYATFTRIHWKAAEGLTAFTENELLRMSAQLSRYGASFFFSEQSYRGDTSGISASVMSTFAKHGERGANTSLVKGSPLIPDQSLIPVHGEFPDFGAGYRHRRQVEPGNVIFECDYDLLPPHDINGVGLIYFASYPIIFDLCISKFEGKNFLLNYTSISKDIYYFANAEADEVLVFKIHERRSSDDKITHTCSIYRKNDQQRMATAISVKKKI
jgi:probable biosynthetic protein (TIGR04098 family)